MNTLDILIARPGAGITVHSQNDLLQHGEWLFVPAPGLVVKTEYIRRDTVLRHGAPLVEELYRAGGEAVYYSVSKRCVLTVPQYRKLLRQRPAAIREDWRIMQRDLSLYGRGTVRHPDQRPLTLHGWHRILMNTETRAPGSNHAA